MHPRVPDADRETKTWRSYRCSAVEAMTVVLALDSAAGGCSVAVTRDGEPLASAAQAMDRGHAEALMPMVRDVVTAAGVAWPSIDAIAATVGPGSFTGVRIGLAAARGLAIASGAATVPITTLEAIATAAATDIDGSTLLVALDSKRRDFYAQWFDRNARPLDPPRVSTKDGLRAAARRRVRGGELHVAGDAVPGVIEALGSDGVKLVAVPGTGCPDAVAIALLATDRFQRSGGAPLRPIYLRPPDVSAPR